MIEKTKIYCQMCGKSKDIVQFYNEESESMHYLCEKCIKELQENDEAEMQELSAF